MTLEEFRGVLRNDPVSARFADLGWFRSEYHFGGREEFSLRVGEGFVLSLYGVTDRKQFEYRLDEVEADARVLWSPGPYSAPRAVEVFQQDLDEYEMCIRRIRDFVR